jgi:hypothetical protein
LIFIKQILLFFNFFSNKQCYYIIREGIKKKEAKRKT